MSRLRCAPLHRPRYCNGCLGSGLGLDRRPARLCQPRSFHHLSARRGACMMRPNSRVSYCQSSSSKPSSLLSIRAVPAMKYIHYYVLWCINAQHCIYVPWMALPTRRAVSFCEACVMSVPRVKSRWLTFDPGPFTFGLCEVWAASQLQLIRLPNLMISDSQCSECTIDRIFSLQKYRSSPAYPSQWLYS